MRRVLVVDDEVQILKALRRSLRRGGFEIETATDGPTALEILARFCPDVVISDFRMPGMNGAQLLAEVKRRSPMTVRILLSGYADLDSMAAAINEAEVYRFVAKPWDDVALRALLASAVRRPFGVDSAAPDSPRNLPEAGKPPLC